MNLAVVYKAAVLIPREITVQNERDVIGKRQRASSTSSNAGPVSAIAVSATSGLVRRSSVPRRLSNMSNGENFEFKMTDSILKEISTFFRINSPPTTSPCPSTSWNNPKALLESLLASEKAIQRLRDSSHFGEGERKATINDIFSSLHSQLLLVIEWAKTLPPFAALTTEDQTALLKRFASQHVVLCVTYRSKNDINVLKLLNNSCIPRVKSGGEQIYPEHLYLRDCERMMDELVAPMRFLKMDDIEFVAMKACILFNPVARGLSSESRNKILESRRQVFDALQYYVNNKIPSDPNRIGDLTFFILSPLQTLANTISEDILVSKLAGVARIDQLMEELILAEGDGHDGHDQNTSSIYSLSADHQQQPVEKPSEHSSLHDSDTLADCIE
ncbi:unnamed protein product [Enterobius vermicularis]|uniref:NR LBD domain-containing protein n=1 Tax=Enterobius vermicularis TaxID=51028 RepID=A0A0N4V4K2_ENTVE|nr:unnamed protein product [Enterobius vermicularis]